MWPEAERRTVEVVNERYREWDDGSTTHFDVEQTLPARIADQPLPVLRGGATAERLRGASMAVDRLTSQALETGLPDLGHLVAVLVRSDAIASSRIEEVHASSEQLAVVLADLDEQGDAIATPDAAETKIVAGAVEAVQSAIERGSINARWIRDLHVSLLRSDSAIEHKHLGAWRDCPVWIGPTRQHAEFEGPPHDTIPSLMTDLVEFIERSDIPAITHAAIAHAQFETIHPFVDGNGRVGRALIHHIIGAPNVPVPVAQGLLGDLSGYIAGLTAYRAGDLDTWLRVFYRAVEEGATAASDLLVALKNLRIRLHELLPTRTGSVTERLIDDLFGQPVITSLMIQRTYGVSAPRASQLTTQLTRAGILRRAQVWVPTSRKVWVAPDILATVDASSDRLPRSVD